jgi:rhamnosyltransferase
MPAHPEISVIVRARDEAASVGRCLELINGQQTGERLTEVIVVDSDSSDATAAIASRHGARVITIAQHDFTFGGALNLGAANARGEFMVALSAHAFPLDPMWLSRLLEPFSDPRVACACGARYGPDDKPLVDRIEQDISLAKRRPQWGYSNGAGAFRADLWRTRPFRSDLPGCEDKEWAWHWLEQGYVCVIDPALEVDHDHTRDPLRGIYRRARREAAGFAGFLELGPYGPRQLAREWWCERGWHASSLRARTSHRRAARLLGAYAGRRSARKEARAR